MLPKEIDIGSPVKVADEFAAAAKEAAKLANRSMAKQIEHWAQLGCAVEQLVKNSDVTAFKAHLADPSDTENIAQARASLERLVQSLVDRTGRDAARTSISETREPVYEAVPGRADRVAQVWPDGHRIVGRLVGQEFVADEPSVKQESSSR